MGQSFCCLDTLQEDFVDSFIVVIKSCVEFLYESLFFFSFPIYVSATPGPCGELSEWVVFLNPCGVCTVYAESLCIT